MSSYEKTGTSGIYKRGDTYSVAYRDPITRKVRFQSAGSSFNDARSLKRRLEEQRQQGKSSPDSQLLFPQLWEEFREHHLCELSPSTQADYQSIYNRYLFPRYQRTPVVAIDTAEVLRFKAQLMKSKTSKPLSPKRVKNILLCLQSIFSFAEGLGLVWSNPVKNIKTKTTVENNERVFLSQEEIQVFLQAIEEVNPGSTALFWTLCYTGVRLGECLALRVGDVDLESGCITVSRSIYRGQVKSTKSGKSRVVGISDGLHEVLSQHLLDHEGELLFPSKSGGFIDPNGLRRYVFDRAVEKSGLPRKKRDRLRIHDLRHSFASLLVEKGVDLVVVKELLGHSSITTTMIYSHAETSRVIEESRRAFRSE